MSVSLTVTLWYCINTNKASVMISLLLESCKTLVFVDVKVSPEIRKGPPRARALYETWVGTNWQRMNVCLWLESADENERRTKTIYRVWTTFLTTMVTPNSVTGLACRTSSSHPPMISRPLQIIRFIKTPHGQQKVASPRRTLPPCAMERFERQRYTRCVWATPYWTGRLTSTAVSPISRWYRRNETMQISVFT